MLSFQIYNEKRTQFEIKKISPKELVEKVASDIQKLLARKRKALEVRGWGRISAKDYQEGREAPALNIRGK